MREVPVLGGERSGDEGRAHDVQQDGPADNAAVSGASAVRDGAAFAGEGDVGGAAVLAGDRSADSSPDPVGELGGVDGDDGSGVQSSVGSAMLSPRGEVYSGPTSDASSSEVDGVGSLLEVQRTEGLTDDRDREGASEPGSVGEDGGSAVKPPSCCDQAAPGGIEGSVSYYHPRYIGGPLGCGGGAYDPGDVSIAASAWRADGSRAFACGAVLIVCSGLGCIRVVVMDACPGCAWNRLDLSEAGFRILCGELSRGVCGVRIERVD